MPDGKRKLKTLFVLSAVSILVFISYRYLLPYVLPFIFAYWLAKLLLPPSVFLKKRLGLPVGLSSAFLLIVFSGFFGTLLFFLLRTLFIQLQAFLQNLPIYEQLLTTGIHSLCGGCDRMLRLSPGSTMELISTGMDFVSDSVKTTLMPALTEQAWDIIKKAAAFIGCLFIVIIAVFMLVKDFKQIRESYRRSFFYQEIHTILDGLGRVLKAYFRMQGIITGIIAVVCTAGLLIIRNDYALLLGIFIAVFDAFPVLGSGLILVPWAVLCLLSKRLFPAAILLTIFLCCQLIRQTMEPRLLGNRIGILPVFTIASIYAGVKLYGIAGVFLGPITLVTIRIIYDSFIVPTPNLPQNKS